MGVSIVSSATVAKELKLDTLSAIPLDPPLVRPFSFVRQRQKFRTHLMDELFQFARSYCEDLAPGLSGKPDSDCALSVK